MAAALVLQRPLVAFDLETTGLDVQQDRIVEISCVKMMPDGAREVRTRRCNPGMPIGAEAARIHGISDADVAAEPTFAALAAGLFSFFAGADLTGFNIEQFDLPMLRHEFARCSLIFPDPVASIIDSWRIFLRHEPRDLGAAYRFYCGAELTAAHSAEADAKAAAEVLLAQVGRYHDLPREVAELHAYCHPHRADFVDADGKLRWAQDKVVMGFGRYRNKPLATLAVDDPAYLRWIADANFSEDVVRVVKAALAGQCPARQATTEPAA